MGINLGTAILISKTGVFDKFRNDDLGCDVMTLGHQVMSLTSDRQKKLVSRSFECNSNVNVRKSSLLLNSYSDDFLKDIGARSIDSLDFSDYANNQLF